MHMKRRDFLIKTASVTGALVPTTIWATSKPCRPPSLSLAGEAGISAPCATESTLSRVAQRLRSSSPYAPAWSDAEIGVDSINADVHYWGEPPKGSSAIAGRPPFTAANPVSNSYNILDWPGKALWDPSKGDWWYSGGPTGNQDPASPTIVRYRPSDDKFVHWQGPTTMTGGIWPPHGHAHSFDGADFDIVGRRIWRHLGHHNGDAVFNFALGWFNVDTFESGTVAGDEAYVDYWPTVSFMPENRLLHLVRPQAGGGQNIRRFDVDSLKWVEPVVGPPGDCGPSTYHAGRIFVTTTDKSFFAILPSGKIEVRAPTPVLMDRSSTSTHAILCAIGDSIYAFCGNSDIWRYDVSADTWGRSRYGSIPWFWPYRTYEPQSGWHYMAETCVGPVPDHGVALVCMPAVWSEPGTTMARSFVWKP